MGLADLAKAAIKSVSFKAYLAGVAPIKSRRLARAGTQRVSIICYHRVNDQLKDNVTVGVEQFDRQIALIAKRYQTVSISNIIENRLDRTTDKPIVAVTFDDGYLDNFENAVPVLKKHKVPAAFFVSTGIVGTDNGFQHDIEKLGEPLPNMNWGQLREMHEQGFEIGAHTVNHANLAKIDADTAHAELTVSKARLRDELGIEQIAFAYCFGGRDDITEERRELVKQLGYTCCFSAYGGTNTGPIDLFDIKRFGVNWAYTEDALRARIEGWQ